MIKSIEAEWSKELQAEVQIIPRGWQNSPTDYSLMIDGTHVVSLKSLEHLEAWLERYFMVQGLEEGAK